MTDRDVSFGCVVAYAMWALVVVLLVLEWTLECESIGRTALALSAAAATATIRSYFVRQNRLMRDAFELGREVTRMR